MAPKRSRESAPTPLPDLLTVEEAARHIRVGRTKAYAMAQEWRSSGGRSGLPVVDFGHVLRVPRQALEKMIGAELTNRPAGKSVEAAEVGGDNAPGPAEPRSASSPRQSTRRPPTKSSRRSRTTSNGQLDLFDSSH